LNAMRTPWVVDGVIFGTVLWVFQIAWTSGALWICLHICTIRVADMWQWLKFSFSVTWRSPGSSSVLQTKLTTIATVLYRICLRAKGEH
jgi:hypothetical protein